MTTTTPATTVPTNPATTAPHSHRRSVEAARSIMAAPLPFSRRAAEHVPSPRGGIVTISGSPVRPTRAGAAAAVLGLRADSAAATPAARGVARAATGARRRSRAHRRPARARGGDGAVGAGAGRPLGCALGLRLPAARRGERARPARVRPLRAAPLVLLLGRAGRRAALPRARWCAARPAAAPRGRLHDRRRAVRPEDDRGAARLRRLDRGRVRRPGQARLVAVRPPEPGGAVPHRQPPLPGAVRRRGPRRGLAAAGRRRGTAGGDRALHGAPPVRRAAAAGPVRDRAEGAHRGRARSAGSSWSAAPDALAGRLPIVNRPSTFVRRAPAASLVGWRPSMATPIEDAAPTELAAANLRPRGRVHPSPSQWRDQVLYFLLPDRFSDGREASRPLFDRAAPAQHAAPDPATWREAGKGWQGGTLAGLTSK